MSKSKNPTDKKRLSKVESTTKTTFKIFAVSFHGTNLEVMEKELVRQMKVRSSKKIYSVMVNGMGASTDGDQTILEATELEQIEEGIQRCKKDFDSGEWESLTSTLSEDLRKYWSENMEDVDKELTESVEGGNSVEEVLPKKIKKSDLEILNSELRHFETCDYFIVLFGKFSIEALLNLLLTNQPLQAIIHFVPCSESDLEVNFPKMHKDIDFLRKSPDTKNVGIFIETLIQSPPVTITTSSTTSEYPIVVEQEEQKYSHKIYDQFTWYLYDIEMLTQQFIVYQTDFVEINDSELPSQEELLWSKFVQVEADGNKNNINNDDTPAVGVFLDNLFDAIENRANLDRKNSSCCCHLSPFVENNYGKIIVEEANELLRSAVANQLNVVSYWKVVNMLVTSFDGFDVCGKPTEIGIEVPEFYELLSWESFVQRFEAEKSLNDDCCHVNLTEDCKLFIFRRSFNKVVEVRKKFQIPVRLGFRDFCSSIVPNLPNLLGNNEINSDRRSKFTGIVFNDTLQELTVFEKIFRFGDGSITFSAENWSNEDPLVSIKLQLFNNSVFLYPSKDRVSSSSKIRLVTSNNTSCNIEIFQNQAIPNIFIQWPNGCQIRYIHDDNLTAVEQIYHSKSQSELKRLYTVEGFVIRYLTNGRIEVLTPNGIVYMLHVVGDNTFYTDFYCEKSSHDGSQEEVSEKIEFVRNLEKYGIYCERFEVTLVDGRKIRLQISDGRIMEEVDNFMVYEWMDHCESKKFLDRDDGVKMVWDMNSVRCYYPCGTIISTMVVEDSIRTNFECDTNIMDNIFKNTNPIFVSKGTNKAKIQDSYVTYNLKYLMQHKNYATVEVCGKDKMQIHSPDGFKLILKEGNDNHNAVNVVVVVVLIDIGEELSFCIAAGVCTIRSGVSIPENKQIKMKLELLPSAKDIISFENRNAFVSLNAEGEMFVKEINSGLLPYEENLYFVAKQNLFGIEFLPKDHYDTLVKNNKHKKYFYNSPTQTVLLKPILPIDEQFSMLKSSETDKDLKHFQVIVCPRSKLEEVSDPVFTARVINKLKDFPKDILTFVEDINFNETTLGNQLNAALDFFFGEKIKPVSPKWKIKIDALQEDLLYKKQRKQFYHAMLKHNIFPKYYEFKDFNDDVKLLNSDVLQQLKQ